MDRYSIIIGKEPPPAPPKSEKEKELEELLNALREAEPASSDVAGISGVTGVSGVTGISGVTGVSGSFFTSSGSEGGSITLQETNNIGIGTAVPSSSFVFSSVGSNLALEDNSISITSERFQMNGDASCSGTITAEKPRHPNHLATKEYVDLLFSKVMKNRAVTRIIRDFMKDHVILLVAIIVMTGIIMGVISNG